MFTGIIQHLGTLAHREDAGGDARLGIRVPAGLAGRASAGDSLAVNGVCLTVTGCREEALWFDVSAETLSRSRLGALPPGAVVNLEPSLGASDPLGGHFVTGHVDGVAEVCGLERDGRSWRVEVEAPQSLSRYIAPKGCITIDGISLTINEVAGARFGVNIVPHTWSATNMHTYETGTRVHLEVDIIARYVERLMGGRETPAQEEHITPDLLSRQGFAPPALDDDDGIAGGGDSPREPDRAPDDG